MHLEYYDSPLGPIEITGTEKGILTVQFVEHLKNDMPKGAGPLKSCIQQLDEYFTGKPDITGS